MKKKTERQQQQQEEINVEFCNFPFWYTGRKNVRVMRCNRLMERWSEQNKRIKQ